MVMGTIGTKAIKKVRTLNRALVIQQIPSNLYIMVDTGDCPSGWTEDTNFNTRYPLGASSSIGTQAGSNTYSHTHAMSGDTKIFSNSGTTYSVAGNTGASGPTWYPPYVKVKFCKKN